MTDKRTRQARMIARIAFCSVVLALAALVFGQDRYTPINPIPLGDTLLSLPTSHIPSEGTWEVKFTHRFNQSLDQGSLSDRVHSLWGLDSNADVGLGLSYAPRRDLQLSFYRSNAMDDIELAAKYVVIQQAQAIPFSAAVRIGGDWRTEAALKDRTSLFGQLVLSRQIGRRAEVFALPTYVTKAGRVVNGTTSNALFDHAFNVPLGAAIMIRPALSLVGELIPKNRDLPQGTHAYFGWAVGLWSPTTTPRTPTSTSPPRIREPRSSAATCTSGSTSSGGSAREASRRSGYLWHSR